MLRWTGAAAAMSCLPAWSAGNYPNRPIKIVVPVAAGGGTDFAARLLADKLGPALGQPVIVENRPGGAGNLGAQLVAESTPDGYTLVMPITSFPINPSLYKLGFDTVKDFAPVVLVGTLPLVLVVHPSVAARDVKELIQLAKTAPQSVTFANSGTGTTAHLAGELFNHMAGTRMLGVPYKGGGPAMSDLLGGHVQVYFSTIPAALPHIQAGKVRALAVTGTARLPDLPQIPTVDASGLPGFEVTAWFGLFAPGRTPPAVIQRLHSELAHILAMPDVQQRLANHGVIPGGGTPESLRDFLAADMAKWSRVVQVAGVQVQ
ncbi:tripartite tricarboxylate transporter substrate binding protein [Pseudorhodoferax sp. Leaf267]|uniref:tripartite tricarboxylate transporter substrate binding protein n=1 Tax=Pseudorhodoferax sp. Leaf267 TaxID=1736316 RepID=UPI0006F8BA13|nr:tripartite tricarboxylate transporter substrate binding protein [Pseudorhodoferax sp. Leaf267]